MVPPSHTELSDSPISSFLREAGKVARSAGWGGSMWAVNLQI